MINTAQLRANEPFLIPSITHTIFSKQGCAKEMIWFVAAALRLARRGLTAQEIFVSIKEHQEWRIDECQGPNAAKRNIQWILTRSPAFGHDGLGHWHMTGKPLVRTPNMLPTPPEESTPAMTDAGHLAYLTWTGQSFASLNGTENGRSDSEFTFVSCRGSRPTELTQFDGHWHMTGGALVQTPDMLPTPSEESTPAITDAGHPAYPTWTGRSFATFNGTENGRGNSESTLVSCRGSRPMESTQFDGHWHMTGSALVQTPDMLPTPLERSTPVMTDAGHLACAYPAWTDESFASLNGAESGRTDSESTFVPRPGSQLTESTHFDGHWRMTGSTLIQTPNMLRTPPEKSVPVTADAGHLEYSAWTDQSFAPFNGTENGRGDSESTSVPFMSDGFLYGWTLERASYGPVHYPEA